MRLWIKKDENDTLPSIKIIVAIFHKLIDIFTNVALLCVQRVIWTKLVLTSWTTSVIRRPVVSVTPFLKFYGSFSDTSYHLRTTNSLITNHTRTHYHSYTTQYTLRNSRYERFCSSIDAQYFRDITSNVGCIRHPHSHILNDTVWWNEWVRTAIAK
jgi:fucose 4-O-acetylase-like acetyltransferase